MPGSVALLSVWKEAQVTYLYHATNVPAHLSWSTQRGEVMISGLCGQR